MTRALLIGPLLAGVFLLSACMEKPQVANARKADVSPSAGAAPAFTAPGWKQGDAASWEQQIKSRAQGQNEYQRASAP